MTGVYKRKQLMLLDDARARLFELADRMCESREQLTVTSADLEYDGYKHLSRWLSDLLEQSQEIETKVLALHDHIEQHVNSDSELVSRTKIPKRR